MSQAPKFEATKVHADLLPAFWNMEEFATLFGVGTMRRYLRKVWRPMRSAASYGPVGVIRSMYLPFRSDELEPSILAFSQLAQALLKHEVASELCGLWKLGLQRRKDVFVHLRLASFREDRRPPSEQLQLFEDVLPTSRVELYGLEDLNQFTFDPPPLLIVSLRNELPLQFSPRAKLLNQFVPELRLLPDQ